MNLFLISSVPLFAEAKMEINKLINTNIRTNILISLSDGFFIFYAYRTKI
jgi:hypothetical protein